LIRKTKLEQQKCDATKKHFEGGFNVSDGCSIMQLRRNKTLTAADFVEAQNPQVQDQTETIRKFSWLHVFFGERSRTDTNRRKCWRSTEVCFWQSYLLSFYNLVRKKHSGGIKWFKYGFLPSNRIAKSPSFLERDEAVNLKFRAKIKLNFEVKMETEALLL